MKKCVLMSGAILATAALLAAQPQQPRAAEREMYYIQVEHVKPAMQQEYEAAAKSIVQEMVEQDVDAEKLQFTTVYGAEFGYVYAMPIKNFAGLDDLKKSYEEAMQKIGRERWQQLTAGASEMIDFTESFVAERRSDLSYEPDEPSTNAEAALYVHYRFYYVIPGMQRVLEDAIRQFTELYREKGVDIGWNVFEAVTGADLPLYVVSESAQSPAEYATRVEELRGELGYEAMQLTQKALSCLRRIEEKDGWFKPALCYPPMEEAQHDAANAPNSPNSRNPRDSRNDR